MESGATDSGDEDECSPPALLTPQSDMAELFPLMAEIVACPAVPARGTLHALHQLVRFALCPSWDRVARVRPHVIAAPLGF